MLRKLLVWKQYFLMLILMNVKCEPKQDTLCNKLYLKYSSHYVIVNMKYVPYFSAQQIFLISQKAVNEIWNKQFFMREIKIKRCLLAVDENHLFFEAWHHKIFLRIDSFRFFFFFNLSKNAKVKICSNLSINFVVVVNL